MTSKSLFQSYKLGTKTLSSRIAMSALTRMRADPITSVPNDLHVKYYSERAEDAGMVFTECTAIEARGNSFPGACGIYNKEQIDGWKKVTKAVHERNGTIFLQLFHCGRATAEEISGNSIIAPSSIRNRHKTRNGAGKYVICGIPEEMNHEEIYNVVSLFEQAAKNAHDAGFDGIELHGANGYLVDSFLRDASNQRNDEYGGSVEKRCRFPLEIIDKFIKVFGTDKIGMKVSPCGRLNDMFDSNPELLYSHLFKELGKRKAAFVEVMQPPDFINAVNLYKIKGEEQMPEIFKTLKPFFTYDQNNINKVDYEPTFIANTNLNFQSASELLDKGYCDMVTFGRNYIANPDLVYRLKNNLELNLPDHSTFYGPGEKGYTTYTKYNEQSRI